MKKSIVFVGLDVHAESIAVAVADGQRGEPRSLGVIPNRPESIRKLVKRVATKGGGLRVCYEAGPTGYVLYWQLASMGIQCEVVAPTLIPMKPGERVKTDRLDALKLVRCYRSGDLTPVSVPTPGQEALRDLVRAREAAKHDQLRARHRLSKFLLRHGFRAPEGVKAWGVKYTLWVRRLTWEYPAREAAWLDYLAEVDHAAERIARLEQAIDRAIEQAPPELRAMVEGLQALRGVAKLTAVTIATEIGSFSRFKRARQIMGYSGLVSSEHSSGASTRRGRITKTGNAHLRRVMVEAAWAYRHRPSLGPELQRRQKNASPSVRETAWKAQHRLHNRYWRLTAKGKPNGQVVTAIARELLGFVWAIGTQVERDRVKERGRKAA